MQIILFGAVNLTRGDRRLGNEAADIRTKPYSFGEGNG
jgi:hypothetical protein